MLSIVEKSELQASHSSTWTPLLQSHAVVIVQDSLVETEICTFLQSVFNFHFIQYPNWVYSFVKLPALTSRAVCTVHVAYRLIMKVGFQNGTSLYS